MQPEATFKVLDEYEGSEFERVIVSDAWIYQFKEQPVESARILSGDFCAP